ncbi:MAG: hypothetical protein ACTH5B_14385 [Marinomonas sp.]|uniref:hypothetical protein n=1 Tax=Marinomonas sp. TaxID=1904862 RepID=UPI003F9A67AF
MELTKIITTTTLLAGATLAHASNTHFGLQVGVASGGDTLGTVTYANHEQEDLDAGSGVFFGAYTLTPLNQNGLAMKVGIGYHSDDITASNGEASFFRFPIDALISQEGEKWQFGLGITYHLNPEYESSFTTHDLIKADDALGMIVEVNYKILGKRLFGPSLQLGVRYTGIEYKFHGVTKKFDGSNLAAMLSFTF